MAKHQSGNAAWKASRALTAFLSGPAWPGPRWEQCKATARHTGKRCKNIAMSGLTVCRIHGGAGIKALHRMKRARKVKHGAWTKKGSRGTGTDKQAPQR